MPIDLLVFGPHPDDIEIGMGASVARHTAEGYTVGLVDLTAGEMGSNGTPAERLAEAVEAAKVLGAAWRLNLGWPDGDISSAAHLIRSAVDTIRRHRPRVVAVPYWHDRHPDHVAASDALTKAVFTSGLRRYETGAEHWRPEWACYYFINDAAPPSFVVDVSAYYERKRSALACYRSQFSASAEGVRTRLTAASFRTLIESRDAQFGALAGVEFAEGFLVREPVVRSTLLKHAP